MKTITVPGQGDIDFPDEMPDDQIKSVIKRKFFSGGPSTGPTPEQTVAYATQVPQFAQAAMQKGLAMGALSMPEPSLPFGQTSNEQPNAQPTSLLGLALQPLEEGVSGIINQFRAANAPQAGLGKLPDSSPVAQPGQPLVNVPPFLMGALRQQVLPLSQFAPPPVQQAVDTRAAQELSGMTTPGQLPLLVAAPESALVKGLFMSDMLGNIPSGVRELRDAQGLPAQASALTGLGANLGMAAGLGAGLVGDAMRKPPGPLQEPFKIPAADNVPLTRADLNEAMQQVAYEILSRNLAGRDLLSEQEKGRVVPPPVPTAPAPTPEAGRSAAETSTTPVTTPAPAVLDPQAEIAKLEQELQGMNVGDPNFLAKRDRLANLRLGLREPSTEAPSTTEEPPPPSTEPPAPVAPTAPATALPTLPPPQPNQPANQNAVTLKGEEKVTTAPTDNWVPALRITRADGTSDVVWDKSSHMFAGLQAIQRMPREMEASGTTVESGWAKGSEFVEGDRPEGAPPPVPSKPVTATQFMNAPATTVPKTTAHPVDKSGYPVLGLTEGYDSYNKRVADWWAKNPGRDAVPEPVQLPGQSKPMSDPERDQYIQDHPEEGSEMLYTKTGNTVSNKLKLGVNMAQIINLVGPSMYSKPIVEVAIKELLQNAFDTSRETGATYQNPKQIRINTDREKRTITVEDDGAGMTPEIIQKAFFTIGGTHKTGDPSMTSGGLGLAKMAFIMGSRKIRLETVKDGKLSVVDATAEQVRNGEFDVHTTDTDKPNGTKVEVTIPDSFVDARGETQSIYFPYDRPDFLNKPLLGPVEVLFNGEKVPIGVHTEGLQKDNTFKFHWGTIDLHVDPKKVTYPDFKVLSSGLYQFSIDSGAVYGWGDSEPLPYNMTLDVRPKVRTDNPAYPFNNQREGWRSTINEDIQAMYGFFKRMAVEQKLLDAKETFSQLEELPKLDPTKNFTPEEIEAMRRQRELPRTTARSQMKKRATSVDFSQGDNVVVQYSTGQKEVVPREQYVPKSFEATREVDTGKAVLAVGDMKTDTPVLHNNTNLDLKSIPGVYPALTELGNTLLGFMRHFGEQISRYDQLAETDPGKDAWFAGISLDKSYRGLNMVKPMHAIWFNPASLSDAGRMSPAAAASETLHIFIHEITHVQARSEGASFTSELANNYGRLRANDINVELYEKTLEKIYAKHWESIQDLNEQFSNFNTENRAASFKSAAAVGPERSGVEPAREGAPPVDVPTNERVQEQGRAGTRRVAEPDKSLGTLGQVLASREQGKQGRSVQELYSTYDEYQKKQLDALKLDQSKPDAARTAHDVAVNMGKNPELFGENYSALANFLADKFSHLLKVTKLNVFDDVRSWYDPQGFVNIGLDRGPYRGFGDTVLEELTHAATWWQYQFPKNDVEYRAKWVINDIRKKAPEAKLTTDEQRVLSQMQDKSDELFQGKMTADQFWNWIDENKVNRDRHEVLYRLMNEHEFVAGLFVERSFRELLNNMNYADETGLYKIISSIKDLLHVRKGKALEAAVNSLLNVSDIAYEETRLPNLIRTRENVMQGKEYKPQYAPTPAVDTVHDTTSKEWIKQKAYKLSGYSAPKHVGVSEDLGNSLVRYASSRIIGQYWPKATITDVLGKRQDANFRNLMGAVLVEDRLRGLEKKLRADAAAATDPAEKADLTMRADSVNTVIGQPYSPIKSKAQYDLIRNNPEMQDAISRHKALVQPVAEEMHRALGGQMSVKGVDTDAFVNLKAMMPDDTVESLRGFIYGSNKGNITNQLKKGSAFSKQFAGTGNEYNLDYRFLGERMLRGNLEQYNLRQYLNELVRQGVAVEEKAGQKPPTTLNGNKLVREPVSIRGTAPGVTEQRNMWIRQDLASEFRQAVQKDSPVAKGGVGLVLDAIADAQVLGATDAVWHTTSMLAAIATAAGGKNWVHDAMRAVPGLGLIDGIAGISKNLTRVIMDTPEVQKELATISQVGAGRGQTVHRSLVGKGLAYLGAEGLDPSFWTGKVINYLDKAGRVTLNQMYENLVQRGLAEDSTLARREFINRMGQYNSRLMSKVQDLARELQISSFVVAGRNFNRLAVQKLLASPGVRSANPSAWFKLRLLQASGEVFALMALPVMANMALTGTMWGRPGTPNGSIDTGKNDANGKPIVVDPLQTLLLRRAKRITGLEALDRGVKEHLGTKTTVENMAQDIYRGFIHPWAGPVPRFLLTAVSGRDPGNRLVSMNPYSPTENMKAAMAQANPMVASWLKGKEEGKGGPRGVMEGLGGAVGVKTGRYPSFTERFDEEAAKLKGPDGKPRQPSPGERVQITRRIQAERKDQPQDEVALREGAVRYEFKNFARQDELKAALPQEQQDFLKKNHLRLPGFESEVTMQHTKMNFPNEDQPQVMKLYADAYQRMIGRLMAQPGFENFPTAWKQDHLNKMLTRAREQARRQSKGVLVNPSAVAP